MSERSNSTAVSAHALSVMAFIRTYVLKRGFLDGRLRFVLAVHNGETSYYRYLKMWLDDAAARRPLPHPDLR